MCLSFDHKNTQKVIQDCKKNKKRTIKACKVYHLVMNNMNKLHLTSPFRGHKIKNYGVIKSNRKSKNLTRTEKNDNIVNKGMHCYHISIYNNKPIVLGKWSPFGSPPRISLPVSINVSDVIGVNSSYDNSFYSSSETGASGEIVARKIHITRETWRKLRKELKKKGYLQ